MSITTTTATINRAYLRNKTKEEVIDILMRALDQQDELRKEIDTAQSIAADKIAEADARGAIAVNCAKAMAMMAEGKVDEETAVRVLNGAEADMLRACEWLNERDAIVIEKIQELQKQVEYWKLRAGK